MSNPTPTRHGNWHVIDGQLVDLDSTPPPVTTLPPAPHTGAGSTRHSPDDAPAEGSLHRRKQSTKE